MKNILQFQDKNQTIITQPPQLVSKEQQRGILLVFSDKDLFLFYEDEETRDCDYKNIISFLLDW